MGQRCWQCYAVAVAACIYFTGVFHKETNICDTHSYQIIQLGDMVKFTHMPRTSHNNYELIMQ